MQRWGKMLEPFVSECSSFMFYSLELTIRQLREQVKELETKSDSNVQVGCIDLHCWQQMKN